jgi:hypothetical protein
MYRRISLALATAVLGSGSAALSGTDGPGPAPAPSPISSERLGAGQLDQLTAPIALYPDPLLADILSAATYPLEVIEAANWLEDPAHATLRGAELAAALNAFTWDVSVKSLVPFPEVVRMMSSSPQWMAQLGDAFIAQQPELMDSIQRLRQRATEVGALHSTFQQNVASEGHDVTIEPANPDVVYVPYYDPAAAYGGWPWPDYPPVAVAQPTDVAYIGDAVIGFSVGFAILPPLWGWCRWNWPGHGLLLPPPPGRPHPVPWHHDPDHRHGIPYETAPATARLLAASAALPRPHRSLTAPEASAPRGRPVSAAGDAMPTRPAAARAPHASSALPKPLLNAVPPERSVPRPRSAYPHAPLATPAPGHAPPAHGAPAHAPMSHASPAAK